MTDVVLVTQDQVEVVVETTAGTAIVNTVASETAQVSVPINSVQVQESAPTTLVVRGLIYGEGSIEMPTLTKKVDFVSDSVFYKGEAQPGSLTTAPVWRVSRVTLGVDGDMAEEWASTEFNQVWDNRASLGYS